MNAVTIRALDTSEWEIFRDLRLQALRSSPGVFATSYAEAAARTAQDWQQLVTGPDHQIFGLFDGDQLIGITGVFTSADDPAVAALVMSFILPAYRGRGLSHLLFDARLAWIKARPHFKRVTVSHRASNQLSERIVRKYRFQPRYRAVRTWPDGETEDEIVLERLISDS